TRGRILTRDGTVWTEDMGEHRIDWIANEGVRISRILRHMQEQPLGEAQRRLRNELFEAELPPILQERPSATGVTPSAQPQITTSQPPEWAVEGGQDGTAVWTIPLQVAVRLGQPVMHGGAQQGGGATAVSREPPRDSASASEPTEDDSELREALAELEAGHNRPYYDEAKDIRERNTYYRTELETGLGNRNLESDPQEAYARLRDLLQQTHRDQLTYRPSKHVYPWVDLHPSRKVRSIYSGREFDAEELIREDFHVEQERVRLAEGLREQFGGASLGESTSSEARLQEALDVLEATLPFNCEHVVPQSWFDKREPMRGDLHHLFACESRCNSFRGNAPYFDFLDFGEAVRDECGKKQADRFEPEAGKGAVARATLYFLLRYPGEIDRSNREYLEAGVETLLQWHRANPPTEYEKHRNAAIFEKQGNRNPLIDFPDWAENIDFTRGLG
ncbi:MAG: endonuclease, partial [Chloroflexota bacterium]|nr:endonuclease [Chloroflexota bacterium]